MNNRQIVMAALFTLGFCGLLPSPAAAYIGPGVGTSAIGTFLAIVAGLFIAILGFLWYPIKRILKKCKSKQSTSVNQTTNNVDDGTQQ
jgi:hypothetical protein